MLGLGGGLPKKLLPGDCLLKEGESTPKPIVSCALLATVKMWMNMWSKSNVTDAIVKNFSEIQVFDALKLLREVGGLDPPGPRNNSCLRPKGEAIASDIHDVFMDLDKKNKLPEIVVSCDQLRFCPVETASDNDPGILVRMERLERAVRDMLVQPPVQRVQQ